MRIINGKKLLCSMNVVFDHYSQVTVTAREDVPHFGPKLPADGIFEKVGFSDEIFVQ